MKCIFQQCKNEATEGGCLCDPCRFLLYSDQGVYSNEMTIKDLSAHEQDPNGIGAHEAGAKLDQGKIKAGLVLGDFARALLAVCEVGTFGANKYSESGWLSVPDAKKRYKDAKVRHMLERMIGVELDSESELPHLAHEAWNALAILELHIREQEK